MEQIEQAVMYALGPQVEPNLKAQVNFSTNVSDELRTFFYKRVLHDTCILG